LVDQLRAFAADEIDDEAVTAVLGVPSFEVTAGLIGALIEGRADAALATIRSELAAGHDAAILYREVGRILRAMLHVTVDPELADSIPEANRRSIEPLLSTLGVDALTRMLGLWLDQEPMLRGAANRELALEVAALRLARWPTVRRLESWIAGGATPPVSEAPPTPRTDPVPDAGGGGSTAAPSETSEKPETMADALWRDHPRLAGAVSSARIECVDGVVRLIFGPGTEALARYAASDGCRAPLESVRRRIHPETASVDVVIEGGAQDTGETRDDLAVEVENDPGVRLALGVIGGEIVGVRPDRGE
jgi:hypothetical protein